MDREFKIISDSKYWNTENISFFCPIFDSKGLDDATWLPFDQSNVQDGGIMRVYSALENVES